jgi:hypothetical protein
MADQKETRATAAEAPATEFIEYTGDGGPQGTTFLASHTIPRGDALWKRNGVTATKDVVWERSPDGPGVGFGKGVFRVPVSDLEPEQVAVLEKTPGFKRVSE